MTLTEKKWLPLSKGDYVSTYDDGSDGRPEKLVYGVVTEIGDESFQIQWEDFEDPTDYEWQKVEIMGQHIWDKSRRVQ